jgi:hypothetical protein
MPSLFKTVGAVLCLVFALCFAAPNAVADEFVYTYTVTPPILAATFTTNPMAVVTTETSILAGDLASFSLTGSFYQLDILVSLVLDYNSIGYQRINISGNNSIGIIFSDNFALSDYSTPGTYTIRSSTLTVTDVTTVATPEPSSLALMLAGVGLVFAMRKRSSGLQQAS